MIERGDTIIVTDPDDEYAGQEGRVVGFEVGMLSGREMALVRLDGRKDWDTELFYLSQIALAHFFTNVVALHGHSVRVPA